MGSGSLVGGIVCPGGEGGSGDNDGGDGGSGRPFRLEVTTRILVPACALRSPDGMQVTETKYFLDGLEPFEETNSYCWDPATPLPSAPALPPPPAPAEVMAPAPIPPPTVNISPHVRGIVGFETWLWYDQPTSVALPPVTLNGWTVTAQLAVVELAWDMGNGDVVVGNGPGTEAEPSAFYAYENQCRPCTVVARATWSGTYTVSHPLVAAPVSLDLGDHSFTAELVDDVREVEAVVGP
ncbi:hypothetical protein BH18ACT4_BH18ACT4_04120 [soil metagenome]